MVKFEGGGAQHTVFFTDRRQPRKSRKSQMGMGGGILTQPCVRLLHCLHMGGGGGGTCIKEGGGGQMYQ